MNAFFYQTYSLKHTFVLEKPALNCHKNVCLFIHLQALAVHFQKRLIYVLTKYMYVQERFGHYFFTAAYTIWKEFI